VIDAKGRKAKFRCMGFILLMVIGIVLVLITVFFNGDSLF